MNTTLNNLMMQNKVFLWIALATGVVLLIPLLAMQLTPEVVWSPFDFVVMGGLLFGMGSMFVLVARRVGKWSQRAAIAAVFAIAFLYLWAELAVGVFTNWGS